MKVNDAGNLPLAELGVFAAVVEAGGFSAAARRLGVSKAMTSTSVSRLERRLGVRLLQRSTRRLSLTEAGGAVLPHVQRALLAARDAEEAATSSRTSPRGTLRIDAPMSFGLRHVSPALGDFARRYPEVHVDLVLDDRILDLVEGGFDLAVRIGVLPDSALFATRIARTRNVLVASKAHARRAPLPRRPEDLRDHPALTYSLSSTRGRWILARGRRTVTLHVRGPLQATSSLALIQAALQGLGIASVPLFLVAEELRSGELVQVLPDWSLPEQGIHVVTTARELPRKTRAFIDFLRERIGDPPAWEKGIPPARPPPRSLSPRRRIG